MQMQESYQREVKRIMDAGNERLCPIPRANAEMIAAAKFWPDYCPHCGEKIVAHHVECPVRE
jgi:predicted amidophosphoribosyltransferase